MGFVSKAALVFLLVVGPVFSIGCSDDSTGPENSPPSLGKNLWSKGFGDAYGQSAYGVDVDGSGNVIVSGFFSGTVDFGGGALASVGDRDIFVVKFGSDGAHLWSKRFGDAGDQSALAVTVDASGNVILAGYFWGSVDFGGGALTSAGAEDIFVTKLGSDGAHLWSKRFGDVEYQMLHGAAVDASGNVILSGDFRGTVNFGGGALTSVGEVDLFVAKLGSDGAHLWSKRFGDAGNQYAEDVAVDVSGNVILTGDFESTVDFGGGALTSAGSRDVFLAKFAADGAHLWSKRFGDGDYQQARDIAVDASGSVIVTGDFLGTVDFGGGALTSAGSRDVFLAKLGSDGAHLWSKRFGDGAEQYPDGVAVDASGNVIITGNFRGAVDFGGGVLTSAGLYDLYDIFVAKFASEGAHLWSKRFGDTDNQHAEDIAVDASGNAIVTGNFDGTVDFGGGLLTSAGSSDIFVAKFGP